MNDTNKYTKLPIRRPAHRSQGRSGEAAAAVAEAQITFPVTINSRLFFYNDNRAFPSNIYIIRFIPV